MNEKLSKEERELFDRLVMSLKAAIKNSLLYPPPHPAFNSSAESLRSVLRQWLAGREEINLGISRDNIILDGAFVKEEDELYGSLAEYLHRRGIVAISIKKGIEAPELAEFLKFISRDAKDLAGAGPAGTGGMPKTPHLTIKELDYSGLLAGAAQEHGLDERQIWQSLCDMGEDLKKDRLSESEIEFLIGLLKDPGKVASVLRGIYEEALARFDERSAVSSMRSIFAGIIKYFDRRPGPKGRNVKEDLARVIACLDAELVGKLFETVKYDGEAFSLPDELFRGLSDGVVADFIAALIGNKGVIDGDMMELLDKLASGKRDSAGLSASVADRLFDGKILGAGALSKLRLSVKEVFEAYPSNAFMSRLYKTMVDMLVKRGSAVSADGSRYRALGAEYAEFARGDNLDRERLRLLLDISYLENNAEEFKKLSGMIIEAFEKALASKDIEGVKGVFQFFSEGLRPEQRSDAPMAQEAKDALAKISASPACARLISFIPGSNDDELAYVTYALARSGPDAAGQLLDAFLQKKDPLERNKFGRVLSGMTSASGGRIAEKLEAAAQDNLAPVVKELFGILRALDPGGARLAARKMIRNKNAGIRLAALEAFELKTEEDREAALEIFEKERDFSVKYALLAALVESGGRGVIDRLFGMLGSGIFKRRLLSELVRLCGKFRVRESVPHLGRVLAVKPFLNLFGGDGLRAGVAASLGLVGTPEALEAVREALDGSSAAVRRMCAVVLSASDGPGPVEKERSSARR